MIAVDTNILVYAHRSEGPNHVAAAAAIRKLAEGSPPWMIPWHCLHEFLSTVTHPRVFPVPTPMASAIGQIDKWLESPSLMVVSETTDHWKSLQELVGSGRITGPLVHDARIAALCLEHGVDELWTSDRDFSRFPKLKTRNPLIASAE